MDFDNASKTDEQFVEEMKQVLSNFIGEWVEELQDGFIDGMTDVNIFFSVVVSDDEIDIINFV